MTTPRRGTLGRKAERINRRLKAKVRTTSLSIEPDPYQRVVPMKTAGSLGGYAYMDDGAHRRKVVP